MIGTQSMGLVWHLRLGHGQEKAAVLTETQLACAAAEAWPHLSARQTSMSFEAQTGVGIDHDTISRAKRLRAKDPSAFAAVMAGQAPLHPIT